MEDMRDIVAISNLDEMTMILKNELENIAEGFIAVGYYLKKVRDDGLYNQQGYLNVFEYAKENFGISRFTASRFMEINDTYSVGGYSPQIEERFKGYGSSKLTEMLQLPEQIREEVPKEATVRDIREVKTTVKETESKYEDQMELCDVAPQQVSIYSWIKQLVDTYFSGEGKGKFEDYVIWAKSNKNDKDKTMEILARLNPSKFKMIRLQTANVLMTEEKIKVMPYRGQGEPAEYTYNEFHEAFLELFYPNYPEMTEPAVEAYKAFYGESLEKAATNRTEPEKESKSEERKKPEKSVHEEKKQATVDKTLIPDENEKVETPGVSGNPSACEELEGQMTVEDFPELMPETTNEEVVENTEIEQVMNPHVEGPYMTRKSYLDTLTEHGMADYVSRAIRMEDGPEDLRSETSWETWLMKMVDEKGRVDE